MVLIMDEKTIRELKQQLDEQYKKDRETLERMAEFIARQKGVSTESVLEEMERHTTQYEKVEGHIVAMKGNFTLRDVRSFILEHDDKFAKSLPEQAISNALWKMKKAGKIKIVIQKKGSSAAIYSNVKNGEE